MWRIFAASLLFTACSASSPTPATTPTVIGNAPSATPVLATAALVPATAPTTATASGGLVEPVSLPNAKVTRVVDGDTIDVDLDGKTERLRLIGIDTPETVDPRKPVQCFGREASQRAHELLDGKTVALEADPSQAERDRYVRLLRYVWLPDGRLYNYVMIRDGYAHEYTYDLPYKYQAQFKAAQKDAMENDRGLWSPATCNGNTEQPAATKAPSNVATPTAVPPVASPTALASPTSAPSAVSPTPATTALTVSASVSV